MEALEDRVSDFLFRLLCFAPKGKFGSYARVHPLWDGWSCTFGARRSGQLFEQGLRGTKTHRLGQRHLPRQHEQICAHSNAWIHCTQRSRSALTESRGQLCIDGWPGIPPSTDHEIRSPGHPSQHEEDCDLSTLICSGDLEFQYFIDLTDHPIVARVARAMGSDVIAYTASPRRTPESRRDDGFIVPGTGDPEGEFPSAWYSGLDKKSLHEFLKQKIDLLVLAVPLT
jgi:hypothetical protein